MSDITATADVSSIPEIFTCPITGEIMREPVLTLNGNTYEKSAIETWFSDGRRTDPLTNEILSDITLVPNRVLMTAIQDFLLQMPEHESMQMLRMDNARLLGLTRGQRAVIETQSAHLLRLSREHKLLENVVNDSNSKMPGFRTFLPLEQNSPQPVPSGYLRQSSYVQPVRTNEMYLGMLLDYVCQGNQLGVVELLENHSSLVLLTGIGRGFNCFEYRGTPLQVAYITGNFVIFTTILGYMNGFNEAIADQIRQLVSSDDHHIRMQQEAVQGVFVEIEAAYTNYIHIVNTMGATGSGEALRFFVDEIGNAQRKLQSVVVKAILTPLESVVSNEGGEVINSSRLLETYRDLGDRYALYGFGGRDGARTFPISPLDMPGNHGFVSAAQARRDMLYISSMLDRINRQFNEFVETFLGNVGSTTTQGLLQNRLKRAG